MSEPFHTGAAASRFAAYNVAPGCPSAFSASWRTIQS
jgi:hypothetical protein